ncbi:MAG TPA: ACP phosphodiesterase [Puia sp.]|nr:ACP phosphodiesterase [Puia sp.]
MNYLAHAYLSFGDAAILTGNIISDFVKGKRKWDYPEPIGKGIALHRAIDWFTDDHPATRRAKTFFRPAYGLYSGPITDIVYDHFLAGDPAIFPSAADLAAFADTTYRQLASYSSFFPERFNRLFPYMRQQDWLLGYRHANGIFTAFGGLWRRASYMPPPDRACELFEHHHNELGDCYREFFPAVLTFASATLDALREDKGSEKIG